MKLEELTALGVEVFDKDKMTYKARQVAEIDTKIAGGGKEITTMLLYVSGIRKDGENYDLIGQDMIYARTEILQGSMTWLNLEEIIGYKVLRSLVRDVDL